MIWLSSRGVMDVEFGPLLMATLSTLAVAVLIKQPLNMDNVVVVPLILGLRVDNGIHIVRRFHQADRLKHLFYSSTLRSAMLSSLRTMGTLGALALCEHQGMFSMGLLLTVAIVFLLLFTLLFFASVVGLGLSHKGCIASSVVFKATAKILL